MAKQKQPNRVGPDGVLLRADPEVMGWWDDVADKAGVSRNALLSDILALLKRALENVERTGQGPAKAFSYQRFSIELAESLLRKGIGGPVLRGSVWLQYAALLEIAKQDQAVMQRMGAAMTAAQQDKVLADAETVRLMTERIDGIEGSGPMDQEFKAMLRNRLETLHNAKKGV